MKNLEDFGLKEFLQAYARNPSNKLLGICLGMQIKSLRGNQHFVSYIEYRNCTCAQFHPEKSHASGQMLLENWIRT